MHGHLDYQQTKLEWSGVEGMHLQIAQGSPKAFLVLDRHRIWNEVDMRDFPVNASTDIRVDMNIKKTERVLRCQVSSDGHRLGIVYRVHDKINSRQESVGVRIIDIGLSKNITKHWELSEDATPGIINGFLTPKFSADLSILYNGEWLCGMNSATGDVTPAQFSWSNSYPPHTRIVVSSCNRFMCCMRERTFKIYELCRSTKGSTELCVRGAQFSSRIVSCIGDFHPHLPILV